jgi:AbrB family looped-hinge helix DNA binding protein
MITIPKEFRERFDLNEESKVIMMEIENHLEIIPIVDIEKLRKHNYEEFSKIEDEDRATELGLEK